jgi:hypothetical protein
LACAHSGFYDEGVREIVDDVARPKFGEWPTYHGRRSPTDVSAKFLRALDVQTGKIVWEIPGLGAASWLAA